MFTAAQYSLIDLANHYGHDQEEFEFRIEWGREQLPRIIKCETLSDLYREFEKDINKADEQDMFSAALISVWDITQGRPTGHLVELDAKSSGCQLMSVAARCLDGMYNTSVLSPTIQSLYRNIYNWCKEQDPTIKEMGIKPVKQATVPYMYGSEAEPKKIMGKKVELFYQGYAKKVPAAQYIKTAFIEGWDGKAQSYTIIYPDLHRAVIPVLVNYTENFEFMGADITYESKGFGTLKKGQNKTKMLSARSTHGLDAFVMREVTGRAGAKKDILSKKKEVIVKYLNGYKGGTQGKMIKEFDVMYRVFGQTSITAVYHVQSDNLLGVSKEFLSELLRIIEECLEYEKSYAVRGVHDGFSQLANHCGRTKELYNFVLSEIYKGNWLCVAMKKVINHDISRILPKFDEKIYQKIRHSKYALA